MTRPTHLAFVEERIFDDGEPYFVAGCLRTGKQCDVFAFLDEGSYTGRPEGSIAQSAAVYLGDGNLHDDSKSPHFCNADHVLA